MKNSTSNYLAFIIAGILFCACSANAQISFKNNNVQFATATIHSGCAITVADMNGDGLDDVARMDQGHNVYIEYQKPGNLFQSVHIGDFGGGSEWGMAVADVDHNGYRDIVAGGNNSQYIQLMKIDSNGLMGSVINISTSAYPNFFMQNVNFMDVNNDGWADIFVCNDNGPSIIWTNDGAGNFTPSNIINFAVHPWTISAGGHGNDPGDAGNYGSVWTDFNNDGYIDLYIAHCRQGVNNTSDPRQIDQLFVNNGNGTFSQMDTAYGVADSVETWTATFGDIDNDGDFDLMLGEDNVPSRIMQNDGSGHYTEITSTTNFVHSITPIESVMEDFDNDGFVDILSAGSHAQLFHNNGNNTFTEVAGVFDNNDMESFAIGDLNHDGKVDVYAGYAGIYTNPTSVNDVFWLNTSNNTNNFITFHLIGTSSNQSALGARAEIFGAWGRQLREVRSGESYGTCNSADLHFGIGAATAIDSVLITWPSGIITTIYQPAINQFQTVKENICVSADNNITANGPMVICTGQSVTLNAPAAVSYLWSNGGTTQSINATIGGDYAVTITTSGNACTSTSAIVTLSVNPDQTPVVSSSMPDLNICQGTTVTLTSTPATSYSWSNGGTNQSTTVNTTGNYTVTIAGACQSWTSTPVALNVYPAPAPTANTVIIPVPGIATLNATGNKISWYNAASGGTLIDTGASFITPFLYQDTVFYATDSYSYAGITNYTGQIYHTGASTFSGNTTNAIDIFDVLQPCVLKTVKVYTDTPGDRIIELRDYNNVVLQSATVNIPIDSSVITLNFNLTPGTSYHLGTNTAQNNVLLSYDSPRLQRSNSGVSYPYVINSFLSITGSDQGSGYYYYFYNWEVVEPATICESERTPVPVLITSVGIQNITNDNHVKVFPNPADGILNVSFDENSSNPTDINVLDLSGRVICHIVYERISVNQTIQLDLNKIAAGTYVLNVKNENRSYSQGLTIIQ